MTKEIVPFAAGGIAFLMSGLGPQIALEKHNDQGTDDPAKKEVEEKAAAEKAAAEKEAAEKAAAEKEAAEKAAAEEAARKKAAEEDGEDEDAGRSDEEKAKLLRETMKRKEEIKELKDKLAAYGDIDADEVKQLIEEKRNAEKAELERKGEFDRLKEMIREEREVEKKKFDADLEAERAKSKELSEQVNKLTVGLDFSTSEFIRENLILTPNKTRTLFGAHFETVDGRTVGYDKPAGSAERTMYVGADGQPLPFDAVMKKLVEKDPERDSILKSKMKSGADSKTQKVKKQTDQGDELFGAARISSILSKRQSA